MTRNPRLLLNSLCDGMFGDQPSLFRPVPGVTNNRSGVATRL